MARKARGGGRGGARGRGDATRNSILTTFFVTSTKSSSSKKRQDNEPCSKSHFSLSEEARNTERHRVWSSDLKLRHSGIAFVSAGRSNAEHLTQIPQKAISEAVEQPQKEVSKLVANDSEPFLNPPCDTPEISLSNMTLDDAHREHVKVKDLEARAEDLAIGEGARDQSAKWDIGSNDIQRSSHVLEASLFSPETQDPSYSDLSDRSDEIILFAGRKTSQMKTSTKLQTNKHSKNLPHKLSLGVPEFAKSPSKTCSASNDPSVHPDATQTPLSQIQSTSLKPTVIDHPRLGKASSQREYRKRKQRFRAPIEDHDVIDDYATNVRNLHLLANSAEIFGLTCRDLGDSDANQWVEHDDISVAELWDEVLGQSVEEWGSTGFHNFDELSTSSEAPDTTIHILSRRERRSGVQYLVVNEGCAIDEARWLSKSFLRAPGVDVRIRSLEERQAETKRGLTSGYVSDDRLSLEQQIALDTQQDSDEHSDERNCEGDVKEGRIDEQIATLLSEQEKLGFGSNNLLLFDGNEGDSAAGEDKGAQVQHAICETEPLELQLRPSRKTHHQHMFPSASVFADALDRDPYNGFDVMDQERPSLRRRSKGRRQTLHPELSDSDLEQMINVTWGNDRIKKKFRKQEREELRAQGFLGKKGKVDLKARYGEGISTDQVRVEIRNFLLSSAESLPLPPMAQKERKAVHEIAHIFKLKSKSTGSGKSRFPILYKTARTTPFDAEALEIIDATLASNRFLPRLGKPKKRGISTGKARGGFANAGVSYRDGEVVGATAPELGLENKGRAMLERMGWSRGTALGASNNTRGIVHPVAQVVKTGKAGLG